jgi:hypothetical protein
VSQTLNPHAAMLSPLSKDAFSVTDRIPGTASEKTTSGRSNPRGVSTPQAMDISEITQQTNMSHGLIMPKFSKDYPIPETAHHCRKAKNSISSRAIAIVAMKQA